MNDALLSSKKMDWCTPKQFFAELDREFHFVLDAAATEQTAKCARYYTPESDGLAQSWNVGGAVFCNPPYGREIGKWVKKAHDEAMRGGGGRYCAAHSRADGHFLFSRLHIQTGGNPLHSRTPRIRGRRRQRCRARSVPVHACDIQGAQT